MDIIIVGYPKSGNTWGARLLGDALDSPITGVKGAKPLAQEGSGRKGGHRIIQMHLNPIYEEAPELFADQRKFHLCCWDRAKTKVIQAIRHPFDVAVSAMFYWGITSLDRTLTLLGEGGWPISQPPWDQYVTAWTKLDVPLLRYEDLHRDALGTLSNLLDWIGTSVENERLEQVIERQAFAAKRGRIEAGIDKHSWTSGIQLTNLRKGIVGDWKNHFNSEQIERGLGYFGGLMETLGYDII